MNKNDWIFLVLIVALIVMVGSFIYVMKVKSDRGLIDYTNSEGTDFKLVKYKIENLTLYRINIFNGYYYSFRNSPLDVENITVEKGVEELLNRPAGTEIVYITQDQEFLNKTSTDSLIAASEFSRILGTNDYGVFKLNVKNTFTTPTEKRDAVTCSDVNSTTAVIYIKEGENRIYKEGECLIIRGTADDIVKVSDRFAYYLAGVVV